MAKAAAAGHRVVVVFATDGAAGLAASRYGTPEEMGAVRRDEARAAAAALGADRVEFLGYDDSGMAGEPSGLPRPFAAAGVEGAAKQLAEILREERADVLTTYDPVGGYGHPDHVQVHRVGGRAADIAGTPVVLEATVDRLLLGRALRLVGWLPGVPAGFGPGSVAAAYTARTDLTHRVDVRRFTDRKRAALAAHASQATADHGTRTLQILLRLPGPLFDLAAGREWYRQRDRPPTRPLLDDVFAGLSN
jgi:LmbE family N-acetylglucosaminyl deacetylase